MKILLSPAKLMDITSQAIDNKNSTPIFSNESQTVMEELKTLKPKKLEALMDISAALGELNWERNQEWTSKPSDETSTQAILAFRGEVYKGLDVKTMTENALDYLQQNTFILSGLYGVLKPFDTIMPYRLEMGSNLIIGEKKNLYEFWQEKITKHLNNQIEKDELVLNLASDEYSKAIDKKSLNGHMAVCHFKDAKNGQYKKIMPFLKHARGEMARFCAINNIEDIEGVKGFTGGGYTFEEKMSDPQNLVFVR